MVSDTPQIQLQDHELQGARRPRPVSLPVKAPSAPAHSPSGCGGAVLGFGRADPGADWQHQHPVSQGLRGETPDNQARWQLLGDLGQRATGSPGHQGPNRDIFREQRVILGQRGTLTYARSHSQVTARLCTGISILWPRGNGTLGPAAMVATVVMHSYYVPDTLVSAFHECPHVTPGITL